jgi:hypothetical protein
MSISQPLRDSFLMLTERQPIKVESRASEAEFEGTHPNIALSKRVVA